MSSSWPTTRAGPRGSCSAIISGPTAECCFSFPTVGNYPFWMKNTLIPLDMIWIDSDRRIVRVKHDVPPCRVLECPSYDPEAPARYVLEIAAGVAKVHGLKEGDPLQFVQTEGVAVR